MHSAGRSPTQLEPREPNEGSRQGSTSKTPEGRGATFRVQGSGLFFSFLSFFALFLFSLRFFSFNFSSFVFFFLVNNKRFFTLGQVKGNARHGRSRHRPTKVFRVGKVALATLKIVTKTNRCFHNSHRRLTTPKSMYNSLRCLESQQLFTSMLREMFQPVVDRRQGQCTVLTELRHPDQARNWSSCHRRRVTVAAV